MHYRILVVLSLVSLCLVGCGDASSDSSGSSSSAPANNATPEAAFEAAKQCLESRDFAGFAAQLTPDSQEEIAGAMVMSITMVRAMQGAMGGMAQGMGEAFGGAEGGQKMQAEMQAKMKKADAAFSELFEKYDLDPTGQDMGTLAKSGQQPNLAALASGIDDKPGFIADAFTALDEWGEKGAPSKLIGSLSDVEVAGDFATGKFTNDGRDQEVHFQKIDGSWRIAIPLH